MAKKNTAKKAKNTIIIILIAAILGTASFFIGLAIMRGNLESEGKKPAENQSAEDTSGKKKDSSKEDKTKEEETKSSESQETKADEPAEKADADAEKNEETEKDDSDQDGIVLPDDETPAEPEKVYPSDYEDYGQNSNDWYRVKNDSSQKGAFRAFKSAKNLADAHKNEGYKVYDKDMKCIYIP